MEAYDPSIRIETVLSGKFRRYQHLTKLQHLTIPSVVFPNIRDAFMVLFGVVQSLVRLVIWRPDVVFAKGGYVCLPVGIAAWLLRIPLVIHDSDAHPGLTNRLLAPFATRIATGVPLEHYDYPPEKSLYVGTPINPSYRKLSDDQRRKVKAALGFDTKRPLTVFTGGGQGSGQINDAVALYLDELLKVTNVVLLSGTAQYDELRSLTPQDDPRFILKDFVSQGMPDLLGAADVVVSRAGATALLELAALSTPTILVPSKRLIWQVKHAKVFADADAVLMLDEDKFTDPDDTTLVRAIQKLLTDTKLRTKLAANLHKQARPHAAEDVAGLIARAAGKRR
jgi:UDP-N-acetylglucosamine--N-acetylmuramyl-(pentapeptide) pyrophosphoryl-undecaprenol N-acetylglucosamine transferase